MDNNKPSLLIVDDEPSNVRILNELLRADYNIRVATSGERALQIALSDAPPDLILLDVMMPGIDGYGVCKSLKADPATEDIPVIFITSKVDEQDEIKGFEAGAVDYVTKPFRPVIVKARVETHVALRVKSEMLKNLSLRDGLTGISNRRRFDEYMEIVWNYSIRESLPLSLILIDIDYFKLYNDHYGHQSGDSCLIEVAGCLASSINRKTDVVARYGGEEFTCILPNTHLDGAVSVAGKFRDDIIALQIPHSRSSANDCITISQGIATLIPSDTSSPETLIKMADQALYKAKENGRNRFCTY
ncbi:MAG: PleD family two-component system response regulator [Nitrospirae bacterium]|uniref:diguanylate cyclase n=1 Tax=Candidatus Magnetobacterium casense TaxID=1455061 RepID=UPI0005905FD3|nr:PleD family two-component system response regulator [Candidatus Magnetobacterium casensis]MBF0338818.1 PleD family two-component system response regulator [Nitrospirota bacterium]